MPKCLHKTVVVTETKFLHKSSRSERDFPGVTFITKFPHKSIVVVGEAFPGLLF